MGLLTDKVAIVTGAGQGLGRAVSLEFSDEGSTVALLERNPETLQEAAAEIKAKGGVCEPYELDITDYDAYRSVVDDVIARFGKIDAIVNNAAVTLAYSTILEDTLEDWRRTIAINLEAVLTWAPSSWRPHKAERGSGRIISNRFGFRVSPPAARFGPYNAAKGGIIALTKSMAVELGPSNILVNAVAPGVHADAHVDHRRRRRDRGAGISRVVRGKEEDTSAAHRLSRGHGGHGRLPRIEVLPLHDGPGARRRWRPDEHVLVALPGYDAPAGQGILATVTNRKDTTT